MKTNVLPIVLLSLLALAAVGCASGSVTGQVTVPGQQRVPLTMTWESGLFGGSGTMTASRIITTAVKAVSVKQIGYAGLMVPVMEDKLLAQRWAEGTYNIDSVLAYSAVCGTGLDTIPLPGDITQEQLERIFGDVAVLATKWNKPLSARLQPVKDKKAGETTDFQDPYLFNTTIHPVP